MVIFRAGITYKVLGFIRLNFVRMFYLGKKINPRGILGKKNTFSIQGGFSSGSRFITGSFVEFISDGDISIGNNFFINDFSRVVSKSKITIGDNVIIAKFVTILDHDHQFSFENNKLSQTGFVTGDIIIGSNVWLGDKVTILKGVTIGNNVIVGANSVVTKSIPSNSVFAGNPGKVIKSIVVNRNVE